MNDLLGYIICFVYVIVEVEKDERGFERDNMK